jgi:hypothetical protein
MAHKKTSYKSVGKKLKAAGFIDYDLRRNLNSGQKAAITRLARQYSQLINKPETFSVIPAPKGSKSALKTAGFTVNKAGKAVIPLYQYDTRHGEEQRFTSAKIKGSRIYLKGKYREEEIVLAGSREFFGELKHLSEQAKNLPRNQMLTVQIDDNKAFPSKFRSYHELYKYLTEDWHPNDGPRAKKKLMARMSIVTIVNQQPEKKQTRRKGYGAKKGGK